MSATIDEICTPKFICSEKIKQNKAIAIPTGAKSYRLKSGEVRFFTSGFNEIPEYAKIIVLPDYEENMRNIEYGRQILTDGMRDIDDYE
ncbi:hypothetical protein ACFL1H_00135 [Nanoarchaeota archaeon]